MNIIHRLSEHTSVIFIFSFSDILITPSNAMFRYIYAHKQNAAFSLNIQS